MGFVAGTRSQVPRASSVGKSQSGPPGVDSMGETSHGEASHGEDSHGDEASHGEARRGGEAAKGECLQPEAQSETPRAAQGELAVIKRSRVAARATLAIISMSASGTGRLDAALTPAAASKRGHKDPLAWLRAFGRGQSLTTGLQAPGLSAARPLDLAVALPLMGSKTIAGMLRCDKKKRTLLPFASGYDP